MLEEILAFFFALSLLGVFLTINLKKKDTGINGKRIEELEKKVKEIESIIYDKSIEIYDLKSQIRLIEEIKTNK